MDMLSLLPLCDAHLDGHVGAKLDAVLQARILSPHARTEILGEALEAFRRRVDDRLRPGSGLWQGEFWGKWVLSAVAAQRYTGDTTLRETLRWACEQLLDTQDPDGYIGTYHDSLFFRSAPKKQNWNLWCRKYTLWGLIEAHDLLADDRCLTGAVRLMDHLASQVGPHGEAIIETGQFYGLPSTSILAPVIGLYRHTGQQRFLDYAYYIVDQWSARPGLPPDIINKARQGLPVHQWFPEIEPWTKAYEFISCVEGLLELYRIDGDKQWLDCALAIHRVLRQYERHIFGGIGKNDKLQASRFLLEAEAEICDAVYWQRFSTQLLSLTGQPLYLEEIERTLYNVLCGAMNADGSWGLRRQCLSGEHWIAPQHCHLKHHHCCVANLPRGLLQAAQTAVMTRDDGVVLGLYIPGTYRLASPAGQLVEVTIETQYPTAGHVRAALSLDQPEGFTVALRIPPWSRRSSVCVNGEAWPAPESGRFAELSRQWAAGDAVELDLDLADRSVSFPSEVEGQTPSHVALMRGPVVLARDIRLGDPDINAPIHLAHSTGHRVTLADRDRPEGVWMAFDVTSNEGADLSVCDFASAGQTWDRETSAFRVWLPQE